MPKKKHAPRKPTTPVGRRPVAQSRPTPLIPSYTDWVTRVRGDGPAVLSPGVLTMFLGEGLEALTERTGRTPRHSLTDADVDAVVAWLQEEDDDDPMRNAGVLAGLATWIDYLVETRQWEDGPELAKVIGARVKALALLGVPRVETAGPSRSTAYREPLGRFHEQFAQWLDELPEPADFGDLGSADPGQIVDLALEEMQDRDSAVTDGAWSPAVLATVLEEFPRTVAERQGLGPSAVPTLRDGLARVVLKYLTFLADAERWDGSEDDLAGSVQLLRSHLDSVPVSNPGVE